MSDPLVRWDADPPLGEQAARGPGPGHTVALSAHVSGGATPASCTPPSFFHSGLRARTGCHCDHRCRMRPLENVCCVAFGPQSMLAWVNCSCARTRNGLAMLHSTSAPHDHHRPPGLDRPVLILTPSRDRHLPCSARRLCCLHAVVWCGNGCSSKMYEHANETSL